MNKIFNDKEQILELVSRTDNKDKTKELTNHFDKLKKERVPFYLTDVELNEIFVWKLRSQIGRQEEKRKENTDENVRTITEAAFAITHSDKNYETTLKLKLLTTLTGVGIPVASAILTLCFPTEYSVIDFRNWRQIYKSDEAKTSYTASEYVEYLKTIKEMANEYGVTPQEIDIAIWQLDIDSKKN